MAKQFPNRQTVNQFSDEIAGEVLLPGDDRYQEAGTVWNSRLQEHPACVVSCSNTSDVAASVSFAREHDLELVVKGGGHDYAGNSARDDGFLLDLSPMNRVAVDGDAKVARVEAGATWGEIDAATQEHGLATPGPTVSTVGVAGSTLGGGQGHFSRKYGLSIDNVRSFEMVTATGDVVEAGPDSNPNLYWALRGGLGNFGVVTEFEFELHEIGPLVLGGQALHDFDDAGNVLDFYRGYVDGMPEDVMCYAFVLPIPPTEELPEEKHGEPAISLVAAYDGPEARGEELIQPLRDFGEPLFADFSWMPYTALQTMFDEGMPKGLRWYSHSLDFAEVTDGMIETVCEYGADLHGPFTIAYFIPMDGAIARADTGETAFPGRNGGFTFHILCGWSEEHEDEVMKEWTQSFHDEMAAFALDGVYVNLLGEDESDRIPEAFGSNYERLGELKREWDPENLFDATHDVTPD